MSERVFHSQCLRVISLLKSGRGEQARDICADATQQHGAEWTYLNILIPAVYAIGELFVARGIDAAACNVFVAEVFNLMEETRKMLARRRPLGRKVLASFLPGASHSVGFVAICHWLERDGWEVVRPHPVPSEEELCERIWMEEADLIAMSCSLPRNVVQARRVIRAIRRRPLTSPIWVGGMPLNTVPGLFERTGADRTARDIVAFTRALGEAYGYQTLTPGGL